MKKIVYILMSVLFVLVCIGSCDAQSNTRTRQIRFATGVQYASDTTEGFSPNNNSGRIWYDFDTDKFRANQGGINYNLLSSGGSFWPLSGSANITGNVSILGDGTKDIYITADDFASKGFFIDYSGGAGLVMGNSNTQLIGSLSGDNTGIKFNDDRFTKTGLEYSADYSADFTDRSMIDKGYGDNTYFPLSGNPTAGSITINAQNSTDTFIFDPGDGLFTFGFDVIRIENAWGNTILLDGVNGIKLLGLQTTNPCASAGSNTLWNDAGTVKICP